MDGGAVWNARRIGIAEISWTVERYGGEVVATVGVGGGDADGLVCFHWGAEDRGEDNSTGVNLLELEEGLILLWRAGNGHRNYRHSRYH